MRTRIQFVGLAACLAMAASALAEAAPATSVEARLAAQNALFEEQYEFDLQAHPEFATARGDYRFNDKLNDYSLAAIRRQHAGDESFLKRLKAIPVDGFPEQDALSHAVLQRTLEQRLANYDFKEYAMPVSQVDGPHLHFADLPLAVPFDTVKHYEDYISRLHQIPNAFRQTEDVLRAGMKEHLMPVRFLLEKVPEQCAGVIAANPFLLPTKKFPASISPADRERLTKAITDAVTNEVLPAYREFSAFIAKEYAPRGRTTLAVTSLPGGENRYRNDIVYRTTLTDLTPEQIHEIGLREIARIESEMLAIARKLGYADLASFRESLRKNPAYQPHSEQQIVDYFRNAIAQMQPKLPELFGFIPNSPVTVEPIPPFDAAAATHYQAGTPDGKRPGRVVVAVSHFEQRSLVLDEAVAYHEGVPGHHLQRSVAQSLPGLPKFRRYGGNSGYSEGWALYAEELGKEVGLYQDPVSDYGRLSSELFRAVRLVVDTGIHAKGWSREQVVDFFRKTDAVDEPTIQSETDRYIAWPGQALAYKLGQLKFRELRERAKRELGPAFDLREFHDEMLNGGVLPLDLLDARTNRWIASRKARASQ
ncbi:MAG TPA: DUF885 domain-containing protein [Steroidobacteraceae bacterium]|nr:DUF885 domain-containing protein [Steroidobacteraceae bacterium]